MACRVLGLSLVVILFGQSVLVAAQTPGQPFDPIVKRLHDTLNLNDKQLSDVRSVFERHADKVAELRSRARMNPYNPQLPPEVDREQRAIRDEIEALLDEDQREKLARVDTRLPIPIAPPFVVVNIPPRVRMDATGTTPLALAAREALMPPPGAPSRGRPTRLTDEQRVLHVLNRITFGPRPGDVERVRQIGIDKFIEQQLNPDSIDDSEVETRLSVLPTQQMSSIELYQFYPPPNQLEQRMQQPNPPPVFGRPQQVLGEMIQQKLARAVSSNRQLQEVLTDFWFNHFNVFGGKEADQWLVSSYERDVIRPRTLGKFRDLLQAVAQSPAMLFYLDNWLSSAPDAKAPRPPAPPRPQGAPPQRPLAFPDGNNKPAAADTMPRQNESRMTGEKMQSGGVPKMVAEGTNPQQTQRTPQPPVPPPQQRKRDINENYARELLELHTLGVDGGYTQQDVQEVARCFTGWTIDRPFQGGGFVFRPWMHDRGPKTVLGVAIAAGGGMNDGLRVLEILSRHPSTARFIAKKLCQRFVSDDPAAALVERVAQVYLKTDGDIREMIRAILGSVEFNSIGAFRAKVKSPLELAASAIRALDGDTNGAPALHEWVRRMGEPLYQYQFPTGYSERSEGWVNTGVFFNRINFAMALANNQINGTRYDMSRLVASGTNVEQTRRQLTALLVHTDLSAESGAALHTSGASQAARPGGEQKQILGLLLGSTEFQRK